MSLANKYRPKTWDDVVEQGVAVEILRKVCESGNLSNRNFLLTGPAGTGKTSISRVIGNSLNKGLGNFIELDAASNSGVEAMRDIVAQAKTYPICGEYKIFILDEVHAISSQGWQVLLKCLEESPAKSVFILCTTNPEKIPRTITSRVQQFRLSKISSDSIERRLKYVLDTEISEGADITYSEDALNYLSKLALGGLRDALTMLDKVLIYDHNVTYEAVSTALDTPDFDEFFRLLNAIAKRQNSDIADIVDTVYNSGVNFAKWFKEFHSFVTNILKYILIKDIRRTTIPEYYKDKLSKYSISHYNICLQTAQRLLQINQELKTTSYMQEIVLSRLCVKEQKPNEEPRKVSA